MKTLLIGEIHTDAEQVLQKKTTLQKVSQVHFEKTAAFPDIEAVVLRTFTLFKTAQLKKFPKLKYVISCSVGLDNLDLEALKAKNIQLIHCPGSNANSVAEHTIYLLWSLLRKSKPPFFELKGKTIGIIGLGYIGKLVARKLLGCEAKVIAFDVIPQDQKVLDELQVTMKDMNTVVKEADIITVHVPLNKHTQGLITEQLFKQMKKNSFFINTSRQELIDEHGLLLHHAKFRGIGLDVYSDRLKQQLGNDHRVIFTDHVAAQGEDSFRNMCLEPVKMFVEKISGLINE
ncbi:NAD(P)-binding domain-containing protein [Candidatus Woesearchaeota archaeon]|nr:NAD(P)-binding domain-containing protein [Candidatus Woesearchaeota archaeon]